jgi:hypothetical protein
MQDLYGVQFNFCQLTLWSPGRLQKLRHVSKDLCHMQERSDYFDENISNIVLF